MKRHYQIVFDQTFCATCTKTSTTVSDAKFLVNFPVISPVKSNNGSTCSYPTKEKTILTILRNKIFIGIFVFKEAKPQINKFSRFCTAFGLGDAGNVTGILKFITLNKNYSSFSCRIAIYNIYICRRKESVVQRQFNNVSVRFHFDFTISIIFFPWNCLQLVITPN